MAYEIGMWEGKVYGEKVSPYGIENGRLDYRTMAEIVGDMVLCNDIIRETWECCGEWELENGCNYNEEDDSYDEVFQLFIISSEGAKWLKEHTDQLVYYNELLDLHVWGITHFGTSWDYVLSNVELVECKTFEELCEFNFGRC